MEQETALLKETVEGAAKVLAEAAVTRKTATDAAKQASDTRASYLVRTLCTFVPIPLLHIALHLTHASHGPGLHPDDLAMYVCW